MGYTIEVCYKRDKNLKKKDQIRDLSLGILGLILLTGMIIPLFYNQFILSALALIAIFILLWFIYKPERKKNKILQEKLGKHNKEIQKFIGNLLKKEGINPKE